MRVASLFSGIGGFELGIKQAKIPGTVLVFSSENNKFAKQIYEKNFGVEPHDDIRKINTKDIPEHDLLVGGFPCQTFSMSGKRAGFDDARGTLFFEIARIARDKRPEVLLLENVRGLLSHDKGRTFETILKTLDEIGYDAEWQVLDSKNFGVPQSRNRVYIIGHLRGECSKWIFPITGENRQINDSKIVRVNNPNHYGDSIISEHGVSPALNCMHEQHFVALGPVRTDESKRIRRETGCGERRQDWGVTPRKDDLMNCLMCSGDKNQYIINTSDMLSVRRLTPMECERLQGFPDKWTEGVSDSERYKCLGNAVTVNVIEYLIRSLYNDRFA